MRVQRIELEQVDFHRNGVGGAPFHVVTFVDHLPETGEAAPRKMVAVVFAAADHVAVFDRELLGQGNIAFGENSWRGDEYERVLRRAIKEAGE